MANVTWRYNSRYGVAYLEDRKLIEKVLKSEGRNLRVDKAVMATYFSPKGKPFAWQVVFNMGEWDDVSRTLGLEVKKRAPVRAAKKSASKTKSAGKTINKTVKSQTRKPGGRSSRI